MTEVTPDLIAGFGNRKFSVKNMNSVPVTSEANRSTIVRKIDYSPDSDSKEQDVGNKIK